VARTKDEVVAGVGMAGIRDETVAGSKNEVLAGVGDWVGISCLYDGGHGACHDHDDVGADHGACIGVDGHGACVDIDGHGACHDGELYWGGGILYIEGG